MNYLILKNIIDSVLTTFTCKNCSSKLNPWDINILWIAGNSLSIEAICPWCKTPWVIKAEIGLVANLSNPEFVKNVWSIVDAIKKWMVQMNSNEFNWIKDSDNNKMKENLKNCNSMEDLFKKE